MTLFFILIACFTTISALAVLTLRNLVHCALALSLAFVGLAAAYLQLNAQFVGFAQILVYVGAVAILIVFAILLTRGGEAGSGSIFSSGWRGGLVIAAAVFILLSAVICSSASVKRGMPPVPEASVLQIGDLLMGPYLVPLEVVGVLLTVALIGAVVLAMNEKDIP
jgi:NADH-quinone oxidoreductase subunit J